jgi:hypothetical protein
MQHMRQASIPQDITTSFPQDITHLPCFPGMRAETAVALFFSARDSCLGLRYKCTVQGDGDRHHQGVSTVLSPVFNSVIQQRND